MIIDCHYHLDERMEPVGDVCSEMDRRGVERVALIPCMCDPFRMSESGAKLGDLLRNGLVSGRWNGLGRFFYRTTVNSKGQFVLLGKTYRIYERPDNGEAARIVERYPERFVAWVFVNPNVEDASAEAEVWMQRPGAIGVKAHPFWHRYNVDMLDDVAHLCQEKGWPMLVHLGGDMKRGDYRFIPERHPKLKLIYAHAAVPWYRHAWDYIKTRENVFVDLSSPYLDEKLVGMAVKALGPEKCLYGSDGPYGFEDENGKYDRSVALGWLDRLDIDDKAREQITSGNFKEVARH